MSVVGIASSILTALNAAQGSQSGRPKFRNMQSELQQLGQDLQSGNLSQAQSDFATLSQNLPGANQTASNPLGQAINQLGQDLQSGNLQAAQQDYATIQQDIQLSSSQVGGHHHHHHAGGSQDSSATQQNNPIAQAFSQLAQELQSGNLQGSQAAYGTLQSDLQQIGGFLVGGSNGSSNAASQAISAGLNVIV
jgi:hypothetical protein